MNDSLPGNSGDTDGDFDLSGFLNDSDSKLNVDSKPKASVSKPMVEKASMSKSSLSKPSINKPVAQKSFADKPTARISKGHRDIKSPMVERPAPQDSRGRSDRNSGFAPREDKGGAWDKAPRYPARKPGFNRDSNSRGPSSIHHIPPKVIERVGGVIHKPASAEVKPFLPLKTDKGRWKESRFLLEGAKNIADVMTVGSAIISTVLYSEEFVDADLLALIKKNRIELLHVSQDDIRALADTDSPQGIIAVANFATLKPDWSLARYVTLLDGVQDPGNVGAILRTSLALGMDAVVVGKGSCDPYNPKVVRSSVGALMRLPFETGEDLGAKMEFLRLKGFSIVATSSHAKLTLEQAKLRKKVALIVGNEGAGTGAQYQDMADSVVKIPLKNKVESLNVSVAHGILTYQLIHGRT
jgi:RNA methyltransferase, TrmH family